METGFTNEIQYATYRLTPDMQIIEIDEQFTNLTGYTMEDIESRALRQGDLIPEEDREEYFSLLGQILSQKEEAFVEHRIRCKDGSARFVFCLGHDTKDENGEPVTVVRVIDVTNFVYMRIQAEKIRKENEDEMESWMKLAYTDELTGLLRRNAFVPLVKDMIEDGGCCALFLIDVDDFKNVNDTCGHGVGDKVLKCLAKIFEEAIRDYGTVCRMGGDEFAAFLGGTGDMETVRAICQNIIDEVDKQQSLTEGKVPIHVSIGAKIHAEGTAVDLKNMFQSADDALYIAKGRGKNRYVID